MRSCIRDSDDQHRSFILLMPESVISHETDMLHLAA